MPPASRLGDNHTCPHVGGPILPPCCVSVLIGNKPAARVGDKLTCGSPPDVIKMGAPNVIIGNQMAARLGDPTAHAGVIVEGLTSVLIGTQAQSAVMREAAKAAAPFCEECERRRQQGKTLAKAKQPGATTSSSTQNAHQDASATRSLTPAAMRNTPTSGRRAVNVDNAVAHLDANARGRSIGRCAQYTREAIEAGGVRLDRHAYARQYGSSLENAGFRAVASQGDAYTPQRGDVVVFQAVPGHPAGHMAMYNGTQWVSDFRQREMAPARGYRNGQYTVYRP